MQYNLLAILASMAIVASALPLDAGMPQGVRLVQRAPDVQTIADAQNQWRADTATVSQFLGAATSLSGADLQAKAQIALNAENDELTHKAVLDANFGGDPRVVAANEVLVNENTFQFVVSNLASLANNGAQMSAAEVASVVAATNTDRCGKVLPAIDLYFQVSGDFLNNGGLLEATRPVNC